MSESYPSHLSIACKFNRGQARCRGLGRTLSGVRDHRVTGFVITVTGHERTDTGSVMTSIMMGSVITRMGSVITGLGWRHPGRGGLPSGSIVLTVEQEGPAGLLKA